MPNPGIPLLKKLRDIPGYPDLWNIPADNSTFWDISSHSDLTRLIPLYPTGSDFCKKKLTLWDKYGISLVKSG